MQFQRKEKYGVDDLLHIMEILRSPEGCPWDRAQTHASIRNNMLEEAYEAVEAIDTRDRELLQEELGDVLFQVVFHARLEQESGGFDFSDVVDGVAKKLVERHPHVFGNVRVTGAEDVWNNWEAIKARSKGRTTLPEVLRGVSPALPALMRAQKLQRKAAKACANPVSRNKAVSDVQSVAQELLRLPENAGEEERRRVLGKLLFSVSRAAESMQVESEQALSEECERFLSGFEP